MRRPLLVASVVLVGLTALPPSGPTVSAQAPPSVKIDVKCPAAGGRLEVTIDPWLYVLEQGQEADWVLTTNDPDDEIEISARGNRWPYPDRRHSGKGRALGRNMKPNARGSYSYAVTVHCGADEVLIDPKMKVE